MTIDFPDGMLDKYYEACDFFLDNNIIGRSCTVVYPPKREPCSNCINMVGMNSSNVYRDGGPAPFNFGVCPLCGGNGYKEVENTDTLRLRVYWNKAAWIRIVGSTVAADADLMAIGYMSDIYKIKQCTHVILASENNEATYRATPASSPTPWGFGKNRYFIVLLKGE